MTAIGNLNQPFIEGGIKDPYFFNGRLLTAEDLQDHQTAESLHHRQLGRIMGEGIARGMEVGVVSDGTGGTTPTLSVTPGLALNRGGQVLELVDTVHLKLVRDDTGVNGGTGVFAPCKTQNPQLVPTGTGVYILVAAPASDYEGKAPMHYLGDTGKLSGCNHKYQKEGVQFRLVLLDITNTSVVGEGIGKEILNIVNKDNTADRSRLRNLLAHLCLGTETAAGFTVDLFNTSGSSAALQEYGPLDALRQSGCIKDTDVPLALILWTDRGLEFTDMWPVRRKVNSPYINDTFYPFTARRTAELEAVYLQFQDHINSILKLAKDSKADFSLAGVNAGKYFRYFPSVSIIPLALGELSGGFDLENFFEGLTVEGAYIEGVMLRPLLNLSFSYEPVDLEQKELMWGYGIRQNILETSFNENNTLNPRQAYGVFSSGYIPFQGDARYDLSRWNSTNYGTSGPAVYK